MPDLRRAALEVQQFLVPLLSIQNNAGSLLLGGVLRSNELAINSNEMDGEMERWSVQKLFGNGSGLQLAWTGFAWCGPGQRREDQRLPKQKMPSRECLQ